MRVFSVQYSTHRGNKMSCPRAQHQNWFSLRKFIAQRKLNYASKTKTEVVKQKDAILEPVHQTSLSRIVYFSFVLIK